MFIVYWERWLDRRLAQMIASRGYEKPYPPQESALDAGLLQGRNVVITSPTSSGKTLVAEIAIAQNYMRDPTSKFLYLVPLKALASEKYEELSQAWQRIGMRVAVTTGDYDSKDEWLARYDLIIATNEKADSLLRQRPSWLGAVKVVVVDEVHLMNDESRGPTLEAVLTRLVRVLPGAQVIAMSATIGNAQELAEWLNASLVSSDWRPVPLRIGVMTDGKVIYDDGSEREVCEPKDESSHYVKCLAEDSLKNGGQFLVFANSRRNAVKLAKDLAPVTDRYSGSPELEAVAKAISSSDGTEIAKELAALIEKGIAFHHAGLSPEQRNAVETSFKRGLIKGIVATPTLAAGVNLPARRVIIPSVMRYESGYGMTPISVMEFRQLCGRAGRPQYDREGEAIAFYDRDPQEFFDVYVRSPPEPIEGHLLQSDEVDFQTLASIASGYEDTLEGIVQFFKLSFSGYKASYDFVEGKVKSSLDYLEAEGFVRFDGMRYRALPFGKRTAELYVKPATAVIIRAALKSMKPDSSDLMAIFAVALSPDAGTVRARESEEDDLEEALERLDGEMGDELKDRVYDSEDPLSSLKTALVLKDWMDEAGIEAIEKKYGVLPGDLYQLRETYQWLFYAAYRLSAPLRRGGAGEKYYRLSVRVKEGIKEELIPIIGLKGIGRVRARILFENGIRSVEDFLRADDSFLSSLPTFGPEIVRGAKESARSNQLSQDGSE